jgi:hypothetical protein
MSIFSRKYKYVIMADETTNFMVQRFADKHSVRGKPYIIDGRHYGSYMILFTSQEKPECMRKIIDKEFAEHYRVEHSSATEQLTYVSKKD